MNKVALYARVSTDQQSTGLESQVRILTYRNSSTIIFELEAYPEPKSLTTTELTALYDRLGTNELALSNF